MKIWRTEGGEIRRSKYCFPFSVSREKIEKAAAAAASCVLWSFTPPASELCCNTWWHSVFLIGYFIVILGISSHTCHLELHAVAFVLHCVLQVGVCIAISVCLILCITPNIVHSSNVNHAMHCINFDAWFQESQLQMHRETVTADKGFYKTEASPAVSDKGR